MKVIKTFLLFANIFSAELQKELAKGDDERCATLYANLTEISRNLSGITALNLLDYLKDVIFYWHNILKDKLSK